MGVSKNTQHTNDTNYRIAQETNEINRQMTESTNQANIQIAQMGNEYNERALERQIENQWQMWNAENEYNSASAQAARMAEAGMNPWNAGVTAGTASAMTAPAQAPANVPAMQAPHYDAVRMENPAAERLQTLQAIFDGLTKVNDTLGSFFERPGQIYDTIRNAKTLPHDVKLAKSNANIAANNAYWTHTFNTQREAANEIANFGSLMIGLTKMKEFQFMDVSQALTVADTMSNVFSRLATGELTVQQAKTEFEKTRIAKADAQVAEGTVDARIRTAENNSGSTSVVQMIEKAARMVWDMSIEDGIDVDNNLVLRGIGRYLGKYKPLDDKR